jgi:molybdopterin-guanine dinucleotide biosynthesis protein MobB
MVAVVGASGSGKTTVLEALIPELSRRGRRVGAVKHTHHSFDLDARGKDSWRLFHAGAHVVAFSSTAQLVVMRHLEGQLSLDDIIARYFNDLELVLVEGYKELPVPKIEVVRSGRDLVCPQDQLLAVISDDRHDLRVPCFRPGDVAGLATFLETRVLGLNAS